MSDSVFDRLVRRLHEHDVRYDVLRHAPVFTSAEAAEVRGTSLASGAKALICKADDRYVMFVLPADLRLDSKGIRTRHGIRSLRFASGDEVREITRLAPGAIPPFGSLFDLPTWCDERMAKQERINFNAGDHAISLSMRFEDYASVERPLLGAFAQPEAV
jgi:Ala-tRNA(Pro) deacylase